MELNSEDRQLLDQLIERLRLSITQLTVPAEDSRGISMVRSDLQYIAAELEDMLSESSSSEGGFYVTEYTNLSMMPKYESEPEPYRSATICEHDKAYAGWILTSDPPQTKWICRKCKAQGTDIGTHSSRDGEDYRLLLSQVIDEIKPIKGEKYK